jgi:hypothetical protein
LVAHFEQNAPLVKKYQWSIFDNAPLVNTSGAY